MPVTWTESTCPALTMMVMLAMFCDTLLEAGCASSPIGEVQDHGLRSDCETEGMQVVRQGGHLLSRRAEPLNEPMGKPFHVVTCAESWHP